MAEHLYIVGGSKGGVGKSIVSMTLIDHLRKLDKKVVLIESDTSNPDVWKAYNGLVKSELVNLDKKEGWMELVDICDENGDCVVVVNTAARNNEGVAEYAETLTETLRELQRKIATLWVINTQKDSLELLVDYLRAVPDGVTHVLKNKYFGDDIKFARYNNSKVRKQIEAGGGKSLTFPDIADRVTEQLYSERMPIEVAAKQMGIGNRAELNRWLHSRQRGFVGGRRRWLTLPTPVTHGCSDAPRRRPRKSDCIICKNRSGFGTTTQFGRS